MNIFESLLTICVAYYFFRAARTAAKIVSNLKQKHPLQILSKLDLSIFMDCIVFTECHCLETVSKPFEMFHLRRSLRIKAWVCRHMLTNDIKNLCEKNATLVSTRSQSYLSFFCETDIFAFLLLILAKIT